MKSDLLLSRLKKVRKSGRDEWTACCPAHDDRSPSLSIKDTGETVLLHCFAGCPAEDVLAAVGMTFADVMPEKPLEYKKANLPFSPLTMLRALAFNTQIVAVAAANVAQGIELSIEDKDKLFDIAEELNALVNYVRAN